MPDIKQKFKQRLIEAGYVKTQNVLGFPDEQWTKGKAIISLGKEWWQADYSDEIHNSGSYDKITVKQFEEEIIKEFDELLAEGE